MNPVEVRAPDVGTAWISAIGQLLEGSTDAAFHLVVRIGTEPDDFAVRSKVNELLQQVRRKPIETVANTIFPAELARLEAEPSDLGERYRKLYPRLRSYSRQGTYFGRLVDYPGAGDNGDQLAHVVAKMRHELQTTKYTSRYECAVYHPEKDARRPRGFPCLSSCAFHLDPKNRRLFLLANYRNQHLLTRGYGNYLGLAGLRDYVAQAVEVDPAELMVVAGHAEIDKKPALRELLSSIEGGFH